MRKKKTRKTVLDKVIPYQSLTGCAFSLRSKTVQEVLQRVRLSRLDVAVRGCGGRGLLCKFN
jgi:hypothetical protein